MKNYYMATLLILCLLYLAACSVGGSEEDDEDEEQTERVEFRVFVSPEGAGTVTPGSRRYDSGDEIEVEATAADGYTFSEWTGNQQSTDNPYTFVIEENTNMTANFVASSSNYTVSLLVADTTDTLRYLEFGQLEEATDGVDGQDIESPPAPPEGSLHAFFQNDKDLAKDYRTSDATSHTWNLQLQPGEQDSLFFMWEINEQVLNGSITIRNEDSSVEVDMLDAQKVAIHKDQADHLLIEYQLTN